MPSEESRVRELLSHRGREGSTTRPQPRWRDVVELTIPVPHPSLYPLGAMSAIMAELLSTEGLARSGARHFDYGYDDGDAELAGEIGRWLVRRNGTKAAPPEVVITNGGSGALALLASVLVDPGDVVLCEELSYPRAILAFRDRGARIVPVPLDADGMRIDALETRLDELTRDGSRVKAIYTIATAHSPTATVMSEARRRALVALLSRFGVLAIQDGVYADVRYGPTPPDLVSLAPDWVVHVGSFSKTLWPSLRLGWAAGSPEIVRAITRTRNDIGTGLLLQAMVARFLASGAFDDHVAFVTSELQRRRDAMVDALSVHCGDLGSWRVPAAGHFLWFEHTVDPVRLEASLDEQGVHVVPGRYFAVGGADPSAVRLAYSSLDVDTITEGIARLGRALIAAS